MKTTILAVLVMSLLVFLAGDVFAEEENILSKNNQNNITVCQQKIAELEREIKALEAELQNITGVISAAQEKDDLIVLHNWYEEVKEYDDY